MFVGYHDISRRPAVPGAEALQQPFVDPDAPVNPHQGGWEFSQLLSIYKRLSPKRVLEIGSYEGGTLYQWMKYAQPGTRIIAIDWPGGPFGAPDSARYVPLWQSWPPPGVEFHCFLGSSYGPGMKERVLALTDTLDFLFIDGDHRYDGAKADFVLYGPLVRKGGVIAFHDIVPEPAGSPGEVHRLWQEIREAGFVTQELYISWHQKAMGIGVVFVV